MKKWYTLLGCSLLVVAISLCSLSASAKEKTDSFNKCYSVKIKKNSVSRETIEFQTFALPDIPGWNSFAIVTNVEFYTIKLAVNDPYLVRSQRWIKDNNLKATAITFDKHSGYRRGLLCQKINC